MSPRRLSKQEQELWQKVARTTEPLSHFAAPPKDAAIFLPMPTAERKPIPQDVQPPISAIGLGQMPELGTISYALVQDIADEVRAAPVQMDKKTHTRLRRGQLQPEARIDLHGMTLDQAHPALLGFIMSSHSQGRRLVLVITGKGKAREDSGPIPARRGVLRHNVPGWLASAPLSGMVMQITTAHQRHGGSGAYYVYLRRKRGG